MAVKAQQGELLLLRFFIDVVGFRRKTMGRRSKKPVPFGPVLVLLAILFVVGLPCASYVVAQAETPKQTATVGEDGQEIPFSRTVSVTAPKRKESARDVPMSITVFGRQDIEAGQIGSVAEITDFVPNAMIFENGVAGFNTTSIRGIHADPATRSVSSALFVDGVPILTPIGYTAGIVDIARIEILRGPQGALYGRNTEAGAINIVSRQYGNSFDGALSARIGRRLSTESDDHNTGTINVNIGGPIRKDRLFFGIAGQYDRKDGFIENTLTGDAENDREHRFGRGSLRWTPTDDLAIRLAASLLQRDDGGPSMSLTAAGAARLGLPAPRDRRVSSNAGAYNEGRSELESLHIAYDINDLLQLTSVSARRVYRDDTLADLDFSSRTLNHEKKNNRYRTLSQELRLDYTAGGLDWMIGLGYDDDHTDIEYETLSDLPNMASVESHNLKGRGYAAFASFSYPLDGRLGMEGGLRWEQREMEHEDNIEQAQWEDSWAAFTPSITLKHDYNRHIMAYLSVSKGYRPGGFNIYATDADSRSYDEEALWSYEYGIKSAFLDDRLLIDGAVYYQEIDDMQVNEAVSATTTYLTNAAKASGMGGELEITARLGGGFSLMAGGGYNAIEFDEFKDALGDYQGNTPPFSPEYTFSVGAQYRHAGGFYARLDLIGYGEMYPDRANEYKRDPYEIVNTKIGYEINHFDFCVYGKNIFDTEYNTNGYADGNYTIYSDPGETGVQVAYRF